MDAVADVFTTLLLLAAAAVIVWLAVRGLLKRREAGMVTVYDYEAGLRYERGKLSEALAPGRYTTWPAPVLIERIDMREQSLPVPGQEILTQDNLPVRVSAVLRWKITDAVTNKRGAVNVGARLYELVQIVLRKRVGALTLDTLLADRAKLDDGLVAEMQAGITGLGVAVNGLDIKDLNLVGAAKQTYADLWRAQKEGLAALERARGEQAALRALANAARMLKGNPELMNLRVLQALQGQPGKAAPTVILGGAPGLVPVSPDVAPDMGTE